jgi:hypothetical protein
MFMAVGLVGQNKKPAGARQGGSKKGGRGNRLFFPAQRKFPLLETFSSLETNQGTET